MSALPNHFISPNWPAPANIVALTTTRVGGQSQPPYDNFNLALHVGDASSDVKNNRNLLHECCEGLEHIQWLNQVHGNEVILAGENTTDVPAADASMTGKLGIACAVMTADCLPLLVCDKRGNKVAAAHAGWKGMAAGIIDATVLSMDCPPDDLLVWLGPAIDHCHFEIGEGVRSQLIDSLTPALTAEAEIAFTPNSIRPNHFFADLYLLARLHLNAAGVNKIYGGEHCSYADDRQFFSYRRDGVTGRMVSMIYKKS